MNNSIKDLLGNTDIYLIDQIMKGRYAITDTILDAGCGDGRNMHWFINNGFDIYGIDSSAKAIQELKNNYPRFDPLKCGVTTVEETDFPDAFFNHIICSAVLHFANNIIHFKKMLSELVRLLKPGGSLFIRMTSDIGIEDKVILIADGVYLIPDGSKRFLLTRTLLAKYLAEYKLSFIEPLKTVNVDDVRCMSTLLLQK